MKKVNERAVILANVLQKLKENAGVSDDKTNWYFAHLVTLAFEKAVEAKSYKEAAEEFCPNTGSFWQVGKLLAECGENYIKEVWKGIEFPTESGLGFILGELYAQLDQDIFLSCFLELEKAGFWD